MKGTTATFWAGYNQDQLAMARMCMPNTRYKKTAKKSHKASPVVRIPQTPKPAKQFFVIG